MKRKCSLILALILIVSVTNIGAVANDRKEKIDCSNEIRNIYKNDWYQFAEKFLSDYYRAIELGDDLHFLDSIKYSGLSSYLNEKINIINYSHNARGLVARDFFVSFRIRDFREEENILKIKIAATISYQLEGDESKSEYGETVYMVLKEEELNKISVYDLYIEDAFDTAIRGYNNQYNETIWLEENNDIALAMENQKNEILKETEKLNEKN